MDTVREGEKGVTRKQRSKSIDHLNASQVQSQFKKKVAKFVLQSE